MTTSITYSEEREVRRALTDVLGYARASELMTQLTRPDRSESLCSRGSDSTDLELQRLEQCMEQKFRETNTDLQVGLNRLRMERYREHIWVILALPFILAFVLVLIHASG